MLISRALPAIKNAVKLLKSPITDFWLMQNNPAGNNYDCATVRYSFYLCDYLPMLVQPGGDWNAKRSENCCIPSRTS